MSSDSEVDIDPEFESLVLEKLNSCVEGIIGETPKLNKKKTLKKVNSKNKVQPKTGGNESLCSAPKEINVSTHNIDSLTGSNITSTLKKKLGHSSVDCAKKEEAISKKIKDALLQSKKKKKKETLRNTTKTVQKVPTSRRDSSESLEDDAAFTDYMEGNCDYLENESIKEVEAEESKVSTSGHLEDLKHRLGLTETDFLTYKRSKQQQKADEICGKGKSLAPSIGSRKRGPPQVIVFDDSSKKKVKKKLEESDVGESGVKEPISAPSFNLDKARHEVHKLGVSGFDKPKKQMATIDLLVKLGAKPPKKEKQNYKDLLKQRELEKQQTKEQQLLAKETKGKEAMVLKKGKDSKQIYLEKNQNKRNNQKFGFGDGQIGHYKHGVQFIKRTDIQRIKSKSTNRRR